MAPDARVSNDIVIPDKFLGGLVTVTGAIHWDDNNATIALAIALAESSGKPGRISGVNANGSRDWGLWQINDKAHADLLNGPNWADPVQNLRMAFTVWQQAGGKWTPWTTYNTGAYRMYMNRASTAIQQRDQNGFAAWYNDYMAKAFTAKGVQPGTTAIDTSGNPTSNSIAGQAVASIENPLIEILKLVGKIFDPHTWVSVGLMFAGGVMLLLVGWQLLKSSGSVEVAKTVKKVVT